MLAYKVFTLKANTRESSNQFIINCVKPNTGGGTPPPSLWMREDVAVPPLSS